MRGFDVLAPDLPLFENHFLEASAGTGKTFAIENLVIRLMEEGVPLEEILVVTFTRAATVELKERIRAHLSPEQLAQFDEARIWTIHSFCFHMLQEHALFTGFALDQEETSAQVDQLKQIIKDFLRTQKLLTPKQLEKVLQGNPEQLVHRLAMIASQRLPIEQPHWQFVDSLKKLDSDNLFEELIALAPAFKKTCDRQKNVKVEIVEGLKRFTDLVAGKEIDPVDLPILLFTEENRTKKPLDPSPLLDALQKEVIPPLATFSDSIAIFAKLAEAARLHLEKVASSEDLVFFEDLLCQTALHVKNPEFAEAVRSHFSAVLIDEFQDTDAMQWDIFSTLFLHNEFTGPVYLVGDPKQSIYRFRSADLYTYMAAKAHMGKQTHASLQTNFRSTPTLVEGLNHLFSRDFITLPKTGETIVCAPNASASELAPISDGKGSIHLLDAEDEDALFSTIVHEIHRLHTEQNVALRECAVLVNDRYQAERFTAACSLPVVSKKSRSLQHSAAFAVWLELLNAATHPRDRSARARVLGGPLFGHALTDLSDEAERFYRYHHILITEGLLPLFHTVINESSLSDSELYQDLLQLVEMGASHKEDYLAFYHTLMRLDPDDESLRARATVDNDAIQLMTIHVSKGLEFSIVFPIGITAPLTKRKGLVRSDAGFVFSDPLAEEESFSEKMRQLYVACTRAKLRLYIPVLQNHSPIRAFIENVDLTPFSRESCQLYPPPHYQKPALPTKPPLPLKPPFAPCSIHSYTSLVPYTHGKKEIPPGVLPVGAHTGTLIHTLFEKLDFTTKDPAPFVYAELRGTHLEPWREEVVEMVKQALTLELPAPDAPFTLAQLDPARLFKEMEFVFPSEDPPGYYRGFIDLFFEHNGGFYILDWKTNFISTTIDEEIATHHYDLQAAIYQSAAQRYIRQFSTASEFKGCFYLFLRNNAVRFLFNKS